jgi:uncharacterized protein (DUF1501 family)
MLNRRALLHGLAAGTVTGTLPWRLALAAPGRGRGDKRFVLVVLRGGMDGLGAVPPYGDPDYAALRGRLALPAPNQGDGAALDLDGHFGLHPALAPFHRWYADKQMLVVQAVATPYRARSHFDGQDLLENGTASPRGTSDGWLNRALTLVGSTGSSRAGLALGQTVPLVLRGTTPVASWAPPTLPEPHADLVAKLILLYGNDPLLGPALIQGLAAHGMSSELIGDSNDMARKAKGPGAAALRGPAGLKLAAEAAGKLLAAKEGPRVAVIEAGGWDTHAGQGAASGRLAQALGQLAEALSLFHGSLGAAWRDTAVLIMTEFGRTAAPNGTGGTDHGTASAAFLLGGAVAGGRVAGTWPGLAQSALFEGRDLAPTTDLRAIAKGVLAGHLGLPRDALDRVVFPNSQAIAPLGGLMRA